MFKRKWQSLLFCATQANAEVQYDCVIKIFWKNDSQCRSEVGAIFWVPSLFLVVPEIPVAGRSVWQLNASNKVLVALGHISIFKILS